MSEEFKFTKKEQAEAVQKVVKLINKYKLQINVDHQISIVPLRVKEDKTND